MRSWWLSMKKWKFTVGWIALTSTTTLALQVLQMSGVICGHR